MNEFPEASQDSCSGTIRMSCGRWLPAFIFLSALFLSACDRMITAGEWNGLEIGQSPAEVLRVLRMAQVTHILPESTDNVVVKCKSRDQLRRLSKAAGIALADNKGLYVQWLFDPGGTLIDIYRSGKGVSTILKTNVGQSRSEIITQLEVLLRDNCDFVVSSFLPAANWVDLSTLTDQNALTLASYNVWKYHIPNSHSSVDLNFKKRKLAVVIYHWTPFEP